MGMYTGIRFKGFVKEEYRKGFESIALEGNWIDSPISLFSSFGGYGRSKFIPCGVLSYMPDSWESHDNSLEKYSIEWLDSAKPTDGFEITYDENTGYWSFQCSLKNYSDEIEAFMDMIPAFIEELVHFEYFYEEWEKSDFYKLEDGTLVLVD